MKKRCLIIRHAKTPGNECARFMGCRTDESLSDSGAAEASALKDGISGLIGSDFCLYVSPLLRAKETAAILFEGCSAVTVNELRELDFGILDGHTHEELDGDPGYQAWIDSRGRDRVPGGESMDELIERSMDGLRYAIGATPEGEDIAIVCHGGNIMSVMSVLAGRDFYENICPNLDGYILELETDDEGIDLLSYDRISDRLRAGSDRG